VIYGVHQEVDGGEVVGVGEGVVENENERGSKVE
jgi:hypothetical protein